MYPPKGCPPLAGRKRHACRSPPRPVFLPRQALSLAPSCAAKPHYTVPDRDGPASLPACSGAVQKGAPLSQNRTLDSVLFSGYNEHKERRCPQTVSPFGFAEITASLSQGGGYFFFVTSKTTVTTPRITRQNWNSSAYVTISISPVSEERGANRLQPYVVAPCPYSIMGTLSSQ